MGPASLQARWFDGRSSRARPVALQLWPSPGGPELRLQALDGRCEHLAFRHGTAAVRPGPAGDPTVRLSQDYATAAAIATGEGSAQRAFMAGRLRVGGDLRVLLSHGDALTQVEDTFAAVRADTTVEPVA